MKLLLKPFLSGLILFTLNTNAQFKKDCVVTLEGDTIFGEISEAPIYSAVLSNHDITTKFRISELSSARYAGLIYEPVSLKKGKWVFMIKEFTGDVAMYRFTSNYNDDSVERMFFRQKAEPKGEVHSLSEKNLRQITTYSCKPVMDSLLDKKDWSTFLPDILKKYNTRCEEIQSRK